MPEREIEIRPLVADHLELAVPLLAASAYKPLRYLEKKVGGALDSFWSCSLRSALETRASQGFLAVRGGAPLGLIVSSENPWETDLLRRKARVVNGFVVDRAVSDAPQVAESLLDRALLGAAAEGTQFVLAKTYADDAVVIHALESRGFLLMDTMVDCCYDYRRTPLETVSPPAPVEGAVMRPPAPGDRSELVAIAKQAFGAHFGRFHADHTIGRDIATEAYGQWLRSSLDGYADWMLLAVMDGRIAGFATWRRPTSVEAALPIRLGHYHIAGIHPDYRGRGLFTAFTHAGMRLLEGVVDVIDGPTHVNNYPVQAGLAKMGWRVVTDARHSFHKWCTSA